MKFHKVQTWEAAKFAKIVRLNRQILDTKLKSFDLTRKQWQLLLWLGDLDPPCSQQILLQNFDVDAAHLTRLLDQLEQKAIITRERLLQNRREQVIWLTPGGKKIFNQIQTIAFAQNELALHGLTEQQKKELHVILDKIENNLQR